MGKGALKRQRRGLEKRTGDLKGNTDPLSYEGGQEKRVIKQYSERQGTKRLWYCETEMKSLKRGLERRLS